MPKIKYQDFNFRPKTLELIQTCDAIVQEYQADGLVLTLRQLYYVLVTRNIIPNKVTEYNRLGNTINDARYAGLIDWSAIVDRTRELDSVPHWDTPADVMESAAQSFRVDKWEDQPTRAEVWIEKEALAGVFERICKGLDVAFLACRGYTSASTMWAGAMRFVRYIKNGQKIVVFHFGDHDPSGIDMTRDIQDRLRLFLSAHVGSSKAASHFRLVRVALNMNQVRQYNPPRNPAKMTDSRFQSYQEQFGESSWELDALNPRVLAALVRDNVGSVRDQNRYDKQVERENRDRALLAVASNHWKELEDHSESNWGEEIAEHIEQEQNNGEEPEEAPEEPEETDENEE